jgi:hypothetical protein
MPPDGAEPKHKRGSRGLLAEIAEREAAMTLAGNADMAGPLPAGGLRNFA